MSEEPLQNQPDPAATPPQPPAEWRFEPNASGSDPAAPPSAQAPTLQGSDPETITWTASEFIAHHKDVVWYASVLGAAIVLAALAYMLTRDKISAATIVIFGVLFCVAAARKPRVLTYTLDNNGLTIGNQFHPYSEYRSFFGVLDGPFISLELIPLKRFLPVTTLYCSPEDEDAIIELLSHHVPYEERPHTLADRFARRIRL